MPLLFSSCLFTISVVYFAFRLNNDTWKCFEIIRKSCCALEMISVVSTKIKSVVGSPLSLLCSFLSASSER